MELSYFNARIRGLRGRLLTQSGYAALMGMSDISGMVEYLRAGDYAKELAVAGTRTEDPYEMISLALRAKLAKNFTTVWEAAPPAARPLLKAYLTAWEAHDLKAVLRGVVRGVKREVLRDVLIPAGEFDNAALNALVRSASVNDVLAYLESWGSGYAAPVREALRTYQKSGTLVDAEIAIDVHAVRAAFEAASGRSLNCRVTREAISMRVDAANIMTTLKAAGEGFSAEGLESLYVEGGSLDTRTFLAAASKHSRLEAIVLLLEKLRHGPLKDALSGADPDDVLTLEESFDQAVERRLARVASVEPMAIALAGSYFYRLVREVKNIRVLARGIEFNIPAYELKILMLDFCPS